MRPDPDLGTTLVSHLLGPVSTQTAHPVEGMWPSLLKVYVETECSASTAPKLLDFLHDSALHEPGAIHDLSRSELSQLASDTGVQASPRLLIGLQSLASWFLSKSEDALKRESAEDLQAELRGCRGIGPNLADRLLFHALGRSTPPISNPVFRIFVRHGWLDPSESAEEAQEQLRSLLPDDHATLAALLDALETTGKRFCKTRAPHCGQCPLHPLLPEGGAREPDFD